jgi:hypothetical protein
MKIALICPSNILFMPYLSNYRTILDELNVEYDIINWDRFKMDDNLNSFQYSDSKVGHKRNYLDYLKYSRFVVNRLKTVNYDRVIVFGLQLAFFMKTILINKYKNKFILDIRDHNKIINFFSERLIIESSFCTVISSKGYEMWLPPSNKYLINHNTKINNLDELASVKNMGTENVNISCIGAIRDYKVNMALIDRLKNIPNINLFFHGEGDINKKVQHELRKRKIKNVSLTGRYSNKSEQNLYYESNLINVLRYNDGINNKTALPNRLYNGPIFGVPLLSLEGTYLGDIVKQFKLGLVLKSLNHIEKDLNDYIGTFSKEEYENGRRNFLEQVIEENKAFSNKLREFIK